MCDGADCLLGRRRKRKAYRAYPLYLQRYRHGDFLDADLDFQGIRRQRIAKLYARQSANAPCLVPRYFNVTTTLVLLPFIKQLVWLAEKIIPEKKNDMEILRLKFVDELLLKTPSVALMQVKNEVEYMASLARENLLKSFDAMDKDAAAYTKEIIEKERIINFTNNELTKFLIKLSALVDGSKERTIGSYFHVLNDLERIGDHAENFYEIGLQMQEKDLQFSSTAQKELSAMKDKVMKMFELATDIFDGKDKGELLELTALENEVDECKRSLSASHYARLAEGNCNVELSPYFTSTVAGLERVADHLINVGYSIVDPTGSQSAAKRAGLISSES